MREAEMVEVARLMDAALRSAGDEAELARIAGEVAELASGFPLYVSPAA